MSQVRRVREVVCAYNSEFSQPEQGRCLYSYAFTVAAIMWLRWRTVRFVRLLMNIVVKNDGDFMDVILLYVSHTLTSDCPVLCKMCGSGKLTYWIIQPPPTLFVTCLSNLRTWTAVHASTSLSNSDTLHVFGLLILPLCCTRCRTSVSIYPPVLQNVFTVV